MEAVPAPELLKESDRLATAADRRSAPILVSLDGTTGLDAFLPEAPTANAHASRPHEGVEVPRRSTDAAISLRDVQQTGIGIELDEAVAIAQSLCSAFSRTPWLPRTPFDRNTPALQAFDVRLDDVFIDAAGDVAYRGVVPGTMPLAVQAVGAVLSGLLSATDPLFIRTRIVSKALASPPEYHSLDELAHALAPHDRPNPREVIASLYRRATGTSAVATVAPSTTPSAPPRLVSAKSFGQLVSARATSLLEQARRWLPSRTGRLALKSAIVVLAVTLSASMVRLFVSAPEPIVIPPPPAPEVDARAQSLVPNPVAWSEPEAAAPEAAATAGQKRSPQLLVNRASHAGAGRSQVDARRTVERPSAPAEAPLAQPPSLFPAPHEVAGISSPVGAVTPVAPVPSRGRPEAVTSTREASAVASHTYDTTDADVTPPSPMYTQLSGVLSPDTPGVRTEVLTISVVVDEHGTVKSVKPVNAPRDISEYLVLFRALSAVKSVQFRPATREGVPVPYRLIVPVRIPLAAQ